MRVVVGTSVASATGRGPFFKRVPLLLAAYVADLGISLNGSTVSAWADQSGTGDANKHLTQVTGGSQPTFTAADSSYGNRATLTFDGSADNMVSGAWLTAVVQPHTVYAVGENANTSTYRNFMDGNTVGARSICRARAGANRAGFYAGTADVDGTSTTSVPRIITYTFNGASSTLHNVSHGTSETSGNPGSQGFVGIRVGSDYNGGSQFLQGKLAALLIYKGAHDLATRTFIRDSLAIYYGSVITLAA